MNTTRNILRGAFTLGTASAIDYVIKFILPIVLVRSLDPTEFGQYRQLWLITNTVMAFAPLYMPQSLFYFLPRSEGRGAPYVANVIWFLVFTGMLGAFFVSPWNLLRPEFLCTLPGINSVVPFFVFLWVSSTLIEWLANTEGRISTQAGIVIIFSLARAFIVGLIAWVTSDILMVFVALFVFALIRYLFLLLNILSRYNTDGLTPSFHIMHQQLAYAVPFGIANMLNNLRQQASQWIVVSLFSLHQFAAFSISMVVLPLALLIRRAVSSAILPAMNTYHHQGDIDGAVKINKDANTFTAILLFPVLTYLFVFAEDVIGLIYTDQYVDSTQPMRIFLFGLFAQAFVVNNLLITFSQGRFQMRLNLVFLPVAILLSLWGAHGFGLMGAAFGNAVSQWGSHIISIWYVKRISKVAISKLLDWLALCHFFISASIAGMTAYSSVLALDLSTRAFAIIAGGVIFYFVYILTILPSRSFRQIYFKLKN